MCVLFSIIRFGFYELVCLPRVRVGNSEFWVFGLWDWVWQKKTQIMWVGVFVLEELCLLIDPLCSLVRLICCIANYFDSVSLSIVSCLFLWRKVNLLQLIWYSDVLQLKVLRAFWSIISSVLVFVYWLILDEKRKAANNYVKLTLLCAQHW